MATRRFKRYQDKQGNNRYDPTDDGIGGLSDRHLKEIEAAGYTVEIVNDKPVASSFDDEYAELLIDELVKDGQAHLKQVDQEIARQAAINKEVKGIKRLEEEFTEGEKQLARVMSNSNLFRQAGVPESMIDREIGAKKATFKKGVTGIPFGKPLDSLYAGQGEPVPAPLIFEKDGKQRRVFTRYEQNPVTGVLEVVPFMDGNEALYLDEGLYPKKRRMAGNRMRNMPMLPGGHTMANELVQETALKLMGEGPVSLNNQVVGKEHRSDFKRTDNRGRKRQTEGMIRVSDGYGTHTVAIPSHTMLVPTSQDAAKVTTDVRNKVRDEMTKGNKGIIEATESLVEQGLLGPNKPNRYGKLLRSDRSRMPLDEVYDELIISGYPMETQADRAFRSDALVEAPSTLHLAKDLNAVRIAAEKVKDPRKIATGPDNTGLYGGGVPRSKMQVIMPLSNKVFTDMAVAYPHTMQLLNNFDQYLI